MSLPSRDRNEKCFQKKHPAFMIAATGSGCGKTTITCGLLEVLKRRGRYPAAFKCGPDYIDPLFYENVLGVPAKNLDTWFTDPALLQWLYLRGTEHSDIAVLEGVMGYYDGIAGTTTRASSWELADQLEVPVILIVNGKGRSLSILAEIQGFLMYRQNSRIRAILINGVSEMFYPRIREQIEAQLKIPVLGFLPELPEIAFESRYLGLTLPGETERFQRKITTIADALEQYVEVDKVTALADEAGMITAAEPQLPQPGTPVRIAVASDPAFCFYYQDNLELLELLGAELIPVSPLSDPELPEEAQGLILGGGYPELHAEQLSRNEQMRISVRERIRQGMPCLAECGGYLYLHEQLSDPDGNIWPMTGVLPGRVWKEERLGKFGYLELELLEQGVLGPAGSRIRGHEFHYYRSDRNEKSGRAIKPESRMTWECLHGTETLAAGFPHLYYYAQPQFPQAFLNECRRQGEYLL